MIKSYYSYFINKSIFEKILSFSPLLIIMILMLGLKLYINEELKGVILFEYIQLFTVGFITSFIFFMIERNDYINYKNGVVNKFNKKIIFQALLMIIIIFGMIFSAFFLKEAGHSFISAIFIALTFFIPIIFAEICN